MNNQSTVEKKDFKFELSDEQNEKFIQWRDALVAKGVRGDSFGCFVMFTVVPSSMGYSIKAKSLCTQDELDLTEYSDWD